MPSENESCKHLGSGSRLPSEIISHILQFGDIPSYPDGIPQIRSLLSVSRLWNRAVKCAPELWTKIDITQDNFHRTDPNTLTKWLERSLDRPLHINLDPTDKQQRSGRTLSPRESATEWGAILICIGNKATRWSYLSIGGDVDFLSLAFRLPQSDSELDHLPLSSSDAYDFLAQDERPVIHLPNLTEMMFGFTMLGHHLPYLQCDRMRTLVLDYLDLNYLELLRMAIGMPNLQVLALKRVLSDSDPEDDLDTDLEGAFQHLKEFAIHDEFTGGNDPLLCTGVIRRASESLEHLGLPTENLTLAIPNLPVLCTLDLTLDLSCHLPEDIPDMAPTEEELSNVLSGCSNLLQLAATVMNRYTWATSPDDSDEDLHVAFSRLIKCLSRPGANGLHLCPKLDHLKLEGLLVHPNALAELCRARSASSGGLPDPAASNFRITLVDCEGFDDVNEASIQDVLESLPDAGSDSDSDSEWETSQDDST